MQAIVDNKVRCESGGKNEKNEAHSEYNGDDFGDIAMNHNKSPY